MVLSAPANREFLFFLNFFFFQFNVQDILPVERPRQICGLELPGICLPLLLYLVLFFFSFLFLDYWEALYAHINISINHHNLKAQLFCMACPACMGNKQAATLVWY